MTEPIFSLRGSWICCLFKSRSYAFKISDVSRIEMFSDDKEIGLFMSGIDTDKKMLYYVRPLAEARGVYQQFEMFVSWLSRDPIQAPPKPVKIVPPAPQVVVPPQLKRNQLNPN